MVTGFGDLGRREITPGRPSNPPEDLGGGEITTGRPPQEKRGAGTVNYESEQTAAELMNQVLSLVRSGLREWLQGLEPEEKDLANLKSFLDTVVSGNTEGTEGTAELETMIQEAFKYIQQFGIDNTGSRLLANLVVQIAVKLRKAVDNIVFKPQLSYETEKEFPEGLEKEFLEGLEKEFLEGLILCIVKLILSVGPNDSEFRGIKSGKYINHPNKYINHPNNALSEVLDFAAYIFLRKEEERAKSLNNPLELIGPISSLLEMTKELRPDELRPIYSKILALTSFMINELVMENGDIDDLMKQLIIDWCINYFAEHEDTFDQFVNQLLNWIPPHLVSKETLSKELSKRTSETGDTKYSNMASRLNRNTGLEKRIEGLQVEIAELRIKNLDLKERIAELEEEITGSKRRNTRLEEENERLRRRIEELERMVQRLLERAGIQTDEEE